MTVLVIENGKPGLRGHLTRWLIEVRAGVYVGTVSSRVRDHIWGVVEQKIDKGNAVLLWSAPNEQGFLMKSIGENLREIIDIDGLLLVRYYSPRVVWGSGTSGYVSGEKVG